MLVFLALQSWKGTFKIQEKSAFVTITPHLFLKEKGKKLRKKSNVKKGILDYYKSEDGNT